MSINGERIGKRLAKRHNFQFVYDPCNFVVRCDREAVKLNQLEGRGVRQWQLKEDCRWHTELVKIRIGNEVVNAEIGSDISATELLKVKHWYVYCFWKFPNDGQTQMCFQIDKSSEDKTEWEPER